jgi:hypothetical protein
LINFAHGSLKILKRLILNKLSKIKPKGEVVPFARKTNNRNKNNNLIFKDLFLFVTRRRIKIKKGI